MFNEETLILILIIKFFFIFIFHNNKFNKKFYKIIFSFFIFDFIGDITLFSTYILTLTNQETIIIYILFFLSNYIAHLYFYKIKHYIYQKSYEIKEKILAALPLLIIKITTYTTLYKYIITQYPYVHGGTFFIFYCYFFYIIQSCHNKNSKTFIYRYFNEINPLINKLFFINQGVTFFIFPFIMTYEILLTNQRQLFTTEEKLLFIKQLLIGISCLSILYYITLFVTIYILSKKKNFITIKNSNFSLKTNIDTIILFYLHQKSTEEIIQKIFLDNLKHLPELHELNATIYSHSEMQNSQYDVIVKMTDMHTTEIFYYIDMIKNECEKTIYNNNNNNNNEKIITTKKIIEIMEEANIIFIYKYALNNTDATYIIIKKNSHNKIKNIEETVNNIYNITILIEELKEQCNNYFYQENIYYKDYIHKYNLDENKNNFDNNYKKISYYINQIEYINKIFSTHLEQNIIQSTISDKKMLSYITHKSSFTEKKNCEKTIKTYYNQYTIIENIHGKKNDFFYSGYTIPNIATNYLLMDHFALYDTIISLLQNKEIFNNNDILFFVNLVMGFECKIIFTENHGSDTIKHLISYILNNLNYKLHQFDFQHDDIDDFFNKITSYFNPKKEKIIGVLLTYNMTKNNIIEQNNFYKKYINLISEKKFPIKWYIFASSERLDNFATQIINIAKNIFYKTGTVQPTKENIALIINLLSSFFQYHTIKITDEDITEIIDQSKNNISGNHTIYSIFDFYIKKHKYRIENIDSSEKEYYLKAAVSLQEKSLKNKIMMEKLLTICNNNYSTLAAIIGVHKSTVSRYFNKKNSIQK